MPPNRHPATREGREWMPRGHPEGFTRSMRHPSHRAGSTRAAQTQSAQARHPGPYPPHPTRINGATKDQKRVIKKKKEGREHGERTKPAHTQSHPLKLPEAKAPSQHITSRTRQPWADLQVPGRSLAPVLLEPRTTPHGRCAVSQPEELWKPRAA